MEKPILRVCINEIGCRNVWGATLRQRQKNITESTAQSIEKPILRVCINEIGCQRNVWGATLRQRQKNITESTTQSIEKPILRACINEIRSFASKYQQSFHSGFALHFHVRTYIPKLGQRAEHY